MDQLEYKYMVLLAKERNLQKAKELAATLRNIRQCNAIRKVLEDETEYQDEKKEIIDNIKILSIISL